MANVVNVVFKSMVSDVFVLLMFVFVCLFCGIWCSNYGISDVFGGSTQTRPVFMCRVVIGPKCFEHETIPAASGHQMFSHGTGALRILPGKRQTRLERRRFEHLGSTIPPTQGFEHERRTGI